jgi:heme iron utilization protein
MWGLVQFDEAPACSFWLMEASMRPTSDFDPKAAANKAAAKKLLREGRTGALATLMAGSGDPYCSLVNVATAADGAPLLLISRLAVHTRNILADPRVSLMLDERKPGDPKLGDPKLGDPKPGDPRPGDPLQGARVMLMGAAAVSDDKDVRRRYLERQPEAEMFAGFGDFAFYRIALKGAHLVAGFGRIVGLGPKEILADVSDAAALRDAEADAIAHMNADHADACRLYATKLLGAPDSEWRCVGIDPEGLELQHGRIALRLPFPERVTGPGALRALLKQLAAQARTR